MKKQITLLMAAAIALGAFQSAALADDPWFNKWDHDHDGHWTWKEFRDAHHNWYRHHKGERRYSDAELRREFDRMAASHPGWVAPNDVRGWHQW